MSSKKANQKQSRKKVLTPLFQGFVLCVMAALVVLLVYFFTQKYPLSYDYTVMATDTPAVIPPPPTLNIALYNQKLEALANNHFASTTATSTRKTPWPVNTVYPEYGALLPFNRIVAYYGNFLSTKLGVLGEYPPQQMLSQLMGVVASWQAADPTTPVIPALDYIAVTAQGSPGPDGFYNLRMPDDQIQEAIALANQVNGLVFLDVQVGQSSVEREVPLLAPYLKLPNVELSLDPEFAMKAGQVPGTVIGTLDASDINFVANYLANIVDQDNLPPKILVVHRFTEDMVTNYQNITPLPEVEVVMDMDGWGYPQQKLKTYREVIYDEPVQFTGFKLFYKNDLLPPSTRLLTPAEILNLQPAPSYIQYQ